MYQKHIFRRVWPAIKNHKKTCPRTVPLLQRVKKVLGVPKGTSRRFWMGLALCTEEKRRLYDPYWLEGYADKTASKKYLKGLLLLARSINKGSIVRRKSHS